MEQHCLRAIFEDDLIKFLESIGIKSTIERGDLRCHVCKEVVSIDSLQALIPLKENIGVLCSKINCLNKIGPESH